MPAVWEFCHKRNIRTRVIKKYKVRLYVDGSKQIKGVHFNETYALVAQWTTTCLVLTLTAVLGWQSKQLDNVAAFSRHRWNANYT